MASRYRIPRCVVEFPNGRICGNEMRPLGERDPRNGRPGWWVFQCGYCGGLQALETERLDRYVERIR